MKTIHRTKIMVMAVLTAASMLAACSKKGGDQNYAPVSPFGGCTGCPSSAALIQEPNVQSQYSNPSFMLSMRMIGDAGTLNALRAAGQNPATRYSGVFFVDGTMTVSTTINYGNCQIPVGSYALSTVQAGAYQMGDFYLPQIQAIGPTALLMRFGNQGQPAFVTGTTYGGNALRAAGYLEILQGPSYYSGGSIGPCGNAVPFYMY